MKTIEERATEYAHQYRRDVHDLKGERADAAFAAYCQGAEDERKELTAHYEAEIAKYKCDLEESRERENIACKAVAEKRDKIARLTKWHDPNITPDDNKPVIICTSPGIYYIAAYDKQFDYLFTGNGSFYRHEIIGWREIH